MIREIIANKGTVRREVTADTGYYSAQVADELSRLGVDLFVAAEETRHATVIQPAPRGRIPDNLPTRARMWRKLRTK